MHPIERTIICSLVRLGRITRYKVLLYPKLPCTRSSPLYDASKVILLFSDTYQRVCAQEGAALAALRELLPPDAKELPRCGKLVLIQGNCLPPEVRNTGRFSRMKQLSRRLPDLHQISGSDT